MAGEGRGGGRGGGRKGDVCPEQQQLKVKTLRFYFFSFFFLRWLWGRMGGEVGGRGSWKPRLGLLDRRECTVGSILYAAPHRLCSPDEAFHNLFARFTAALPMEINGH